MASPVPLELCALFKLGRNKVFHAAPLSKPLDAGLPDRQDLETNFLYTLYKLGNPAAVANL